MQIMKALVLPKQGWRYHPAVVQWEGYEWALLQYQRAIVHEWRRRGYRDTCLAKTESLAARVRMRREWPWWLWWPAYHRSHQSNLLRKNPSWYGQFFPTVSPDLEYVWPSQTI